MEKHYNEQYFFAERKQGGKKWVDKDGGVHEFGYAGGGIWDFKGIYDKLAQLLGTPKSIIDLGAGCGGFVSFTASQGIDSTGLEFSRFAVDNCLPGARAHLVHWDLANIPWPAKDEGYDWSTAIDFFEHIFESDVDAVVAEAKRVTKHWIISKICTAQLPHEVWVAKKASLEGVLAQAKKDGYEWLTVSGHVLSQFPDYWRRKLEDEEWKLRDDLSQEMRHSMNLPEDWRTTLILEKQAKKSDIPIGDFTQNYYDKRYFASGEGKTFRMPDSSTRRWGYMNPTGAWGGCSPIVKAWKQIFDPLKTMLDAGAGRGPFIAAARQQGVEAWGFDYSEYAVGEGRVIDCKPEWLKLHDAAQPWPYPAKSFDLVVVLDMLEHIYEEDLEKVISEVYRVAGKWVFLQVAVSGSGGLQGTSQKGYMLKKGEAVPVELEQYAVAGHCTVQPEGFWLELLERDQFILRRDMVEWFKGLVGPDIIANWTKNLIYIATRLEL